MSARRNARPAVKVGAHVRFRGVKWQVVALSGQDVHLLGPDGGGEVVLAGHLFADPGFAVIGADAPQAAPQWGLFETAPAAAREKALAWQRHVREVECGLTGGPGSEGVVREQYDPERHTLAEREQAKAEELTALGFGRVSRTTVQRMRLAYRKQGLWGLLDHRTTRASSPTGRADERVLAASRRSAAPPPRPLPRHHQRPVPADQPDPSGPARARYGARAVAGHAVPAGHRPGPAR
ncbi:hypothetical protein [Streptomyces sp. NPDC021356]|uniref:hypothetical protein n=1 Tax=Streptomyces sp. NPDC021356 TaxID=3154900 RepID=UPI0033F49038